MGSLGGRVARLEHSVCAGRGARAAREAELAGAVEELDARLKAMAERRRAAGIPPITDPAEVERIKAAVRDRLEELRAEMARDRAGGRPGPLITHHARPHLKNLIGS